jgi:signal transduction histidine kinase
VIATRPALGSVLVVDDDRAMRETVVEILAATGIKAEGVGSAAEAHARQAQLAPAVALIDQRLPDATGIEVGSGLKERDADLTVLLVTGYANLENAIAAVWQFDGFLTKPVPPVELLRVVRAGLESARLRRENRRLMAERTAELSGLLTMAEALAGALELDAVVDACLRTALDVTGARYAELYLGAELRGRLGSRRRGDDEQRVVLTAGGSEVGTLVLGAAERAQPMFLASLAASAAIAIQNVQRLEHVSELSRMKSTFLATVSHELRTPLTSVIGFADMLTRRFATSSDADRIGMIEHIATQSRRLGVLIEDLVDASRVEFGGVRVALEDVDVARVLARIERTFETVVVRADPDLPAARADPRRLEQVMTNLVDNAVKHSPPGAAVEIGATAEDEHVRVSVIDRGSGIDPRFLPQLFEPFVQADGAPGRDGGLGLGLYIVRGLLDAMGGSIAARSRLGEGSEFVVRLRRAAGPAGNLAPAANPAS